MAEKKAYVVTAGEYSDYRIVGVFDNPELARAFVDSYNGAEQAYAAEIEEWPLNPCREELRKGLHAFYVRMSEEGLVEEISRTDPPPDREDRIVKTSQGPIVLIAETWAKDEKHAAKIVNERRARLIAENRWSPMKTAFDIERVVALPMGNLTTGEVANSLSPRPPVKRSE